MWRSPLAPRSQRRTFVHRIATRAHHKRRMEMNRGYIRALQLMALAAPLALGACASDQGASSTTTSTAANDQSAQALATAQQALKTAQQAQATADQANQKADRM